MESLILTCLVIVILLLLHDKIFPKKTISQKKPEENNTVGFSDIMGETRSVSRLSLPLPDKSSQTKKVDGSAVTFESESGGNSTGIEIPQEEEEEVFMVMPDFEEEEEEWRIDGLSEGGQGFAMGVTFEELSAVGVLLLKEKPGASEIEEAADIVQRIQGTELLSLLESSMKGASEKIAQLLDRSIARESTSFSSIMRNGELDQFDIGEFV
ncbi:conjugal transfer protein TraD [Chryseobacterium sp. CKR4-1]|uniref:conjugal transfer protein TraD n=1 Tax=Chryseobacterium sp. CKR4-1 TaxID=3068896 RepID=UPI002796D396|nr:conjugal transfer protein TraD [Chryseobacterium sp. CKR4-1]MDQ1803076.1 conjugal transfer protein TraD [Chryseobacterium sp. CKR4-1]